MVSTRDEDDAAAAVNRLLDDYRLRCAWFLRPDYYPANLAERLRILDYVDRHGDREGFRRAADLRRWLLPTSNAPSAGS